MQANGEKTPEAGISGGIALKANWLIQILSISLLFIGFANGASAGELRAGAAKVSITPASDEFPYQIGREKPFVGVHDDVFARALVLDDGESRVALVVEEVESIPDPKGTVTQVAQAIGVPESNVIVSATHSHESLTVFIHGNQLTPAQQKEIEHCRAGAVEAARQAAANLKPARISFGRGEAYVNINNGEQSGIAYWYDPKGPTDKTLDLLRVEAASGQPIAMVVNYGTHAETMYRSLVKDGGYEVTGDIPGEVSHIMETNQAGAPVVLFTAPAEADELGYFKSLQPANGSLPETDEGAAGYALMNEMSRRIAAAAFQIEGAMNPGKSNVTLQALTGTATCPGGRTRVDNQTHQVVSTDGPPVVIPMSVIKINDIAIAAVAADMGNQIGKEIKQVSPIPNTMVVSQLAGAVGYILPDASYEHPGHGLGGSPVKAGCAEKAIPNGIASLLGARP
jgi:hypothetical protein